MNFKFKRENLTLKQKKVLSVLVILLFVGFCAAVTWFIGRPMIRFVEEPEKFRSWVDAHGILGKICFIGMTAFQVIIAFVPGEPLEIGAGYAFGAVEGTLLCVIGITLGSMLTFLLVRRFGVRFAEIFFTIEKIKSLKFLQNEKKLGFIIFLIFFLPGTPKDLITYFIGLTDIKLSHYLLLVSIARLPSVITSTVGGSALGTTKYTLAIVVFSATLLLSGLGLLCYNFISRKRTKEDKNVRNQRIS